MTIKRTILQDEINCYWQLKGILLNLLNFFLGKFDSFYKDALGPDVIQEFIDNEF